MRDRIDRRVEFRVDVADEVGLPEERRRFWRDHGRVLDDPLQPSVEIPHRNDQVMWQSLLESNDGLLRIAEPGSRQNRVIPVLGGNYKSLINPPGGSIDEVGLINDRSHGTELVDLGARDSINHREIRDEQRADKSLLD